MCVILIAETHPLTERTIRDAVRSNPDGIGMAWRESNRVSFAKGLTIENAIELAENVPLPYVFHARIATIGAVSDELCHPFPLDKRLSIDATAGVSSRGVLFHNGHWCVAAEDTEGNDLFDSPHWSDTKLMAWRLREHEFKHVSEFVPPHQKVVVLTPKTLERYGNSWVRMQRGVWASNDRGLSESTLLFKNAPMFNQKARVSA